MSSFLEKSRACLTAAGVLLVLPGCVQGKLVGVKGSARYTCYEQGLQPGTPEHTACWKAIAARDNVNLGELMLGAAAVAASAKTATPVVLPPTIPQMPPPSDRTSNGISAIRSGEGCVYWTPMGKRVMQPVNGVCPKYGE